MKHQSEFKSDWPWTRTNHQTDHNQLLSRDRISCADNRRKAKDKKELFFVSVWNPETSADGMEITAVSLPRRLTAANLAVHY